MVYLLKNEINSFALPLLEFSSITNHGYFLKLTNELSESIEYIIPTIIEENERITKLEIEANFPSGQYLFEVFETDVIDPLPITELGLTKIYFGMLIIQETNNVSIYA